MLVNGVYQGYLFPKDLEAILKSRGFLRQVFEDFRSFRRTSQFRRLIDRFIVSSAHKIVGDTKVTSRRDNEKEQNQFGDLGLSITYGDSVNLETAVTEFEQARSVLLPKLGKSTHKHYTVVHVTGFGRFSGYWTLDNYDEKKISQIDGSALMHGFVQLVAEISRYYPSPDLAKADLSSSCDFVHFHSSHIANIIGQVNGMHVYDKYPSIGLVRIVDTLDLKAIESFYSEASALHTRVSVASSADSKIVWPYFRTMDFMIRAPLEVDGRRYILSYSTYYLKNINMMERFV